MDVEPEALRQLAHRQALILWRTRLEEEKNVRQRAVGAILPNLEAWLSRKSGSVTFRLTQVLTGHGCFGEYLCRIGREATPKCHHCGGDRDTAQHTLEECPAWDQERHLLISHVGRDLSPAAVIAAMLAEDRAWKAVVSFCETVLVKKEAAERDRERANPARRRQRPTVLEIEPTALDSKSRIGADCARRQFKKIERKKKKTDSLDY
ncbi:jg8471 [Pararge aegeria aegeria]|uniref:Jg8471 protein n=1 Tax=Pararge aegeria aegeria TaxID=348720 RepID=A0A8S4RZQ5_9NEOP|nr:jg8471 [Pararge aegeria aegeria]